MAYINIILKEDEFNNFNINNKNEYSSDSLLLISKNSKTHYESKNKYDIFNILYSNLIIIYLFFLTILYFSTFIQINILFKCKNF